MSHNVPKKFLSIGYINCLIGINCLIVIRLMGNDPPPLENSRTEVNRKLGMRGSWCIVWGSEVNMILIT